MLKLPFSQGFCGIRAKKDVLKLF
jgi:hypothetical protein